MWALFMAGIAGSLAKRVLFALGIGAVTFTGFSVMQGNIGYLIDTQMGVLPGDVYKILALAGFVDAFGIWLGALTTAGFILSFGRLGFLAAR